MADQLTTLGEPVRESTLVLNILHSLNDHYSHMASFIKRQRPMPDYGDLLADLELEEITMLYKQGSQALAAYAPWPAVPAPSSARPINHRHSGGLQNATSSGGSRNRNRRGKRSNNGGGSGQNTQNG